jgi:hypothetical protein
MSHFIVGIQFKIGSIRVIYNKFDHTFSQVRMQASGNQGHGPGRGGDA